VFQNYWPAFTDLIRIPFRDAELVWGIVPLYFGWMLNEVTSPKASYRTALQTGFSFLWAGAHWVYQYSHPVRGARIRSGGAAPVNWLVTGLVLAVGLLALYSGFRRRFPRYGSFLGHTRFANYFMIAVFPIQSGCLLWSWQRLGAMVLFAIPIWVTIELLVAPLHLSGRKGR
jgi:hypothetical protein